MSVEDPRTRRLAAEASSEADSRSAYQRDRDRILYCAQFRRLGGVTQVTSPVELHSFHNRLTHTLEVAQLARRMAERFLREDPSRSAVLDPDVCEAAALIHDLGHPPFGHNGEKTLDKLASEANDPDGYEGNAQSFRIVTKLAARSVGETGLNLTAATLRASIKYPWLREKAGPRHSKYGIFRTEQQDFETLYGKGGGDKTLEAEIMDWADDIAYSVHDLYDFVLAGLLPLDRLKSIEVDELRSLLKGRSSLQNAPDEAFRNVVMALRPLPESNLARTSHFSSELVAGLKSWVSANITRFVSSELRLVNVEGTLRLERAGTVEQEVEILKGLTYLFAIGSPTLAVRQIGERSILSSLFRILKDDAMGTGLLLSDDARNRLNDGVQPIRVVLDTISSMTDAQAVALNARLTGQSLSSILDATTTSVL